MVLDEALEGVNVFSFLVSLVVSASPGDGTTLDIRAFQVVKQSSGPVDGWMHGAPPRLKMLWS